MDGLDTAGRCPFVQMAGSAVVAGHGANDSGRDTISRFKSDTGTLYNVPARNKSKAE